MIKAAPRLLITGASGYIGQRLVELAIERGIRVVVLGTLPGVDVDRAYPWRLGERPHPSVFDRVSAVIHLGHSWDSDSIQRTTSENVNFLGTEALAQAAFAAGIPRFVFASTTSARPEALNFYGQFKYLTEQRLLTLPGAGQDVLCARIGLVYGGPERGQNGLLSKLVRATPFLPMFGLSRKIKLIHLDEVCEGLLALATLPNSSEGSRRMYVLAGPDSVTFGEWLRILRRAVTGKGIVLLSVPLWAALLACDITRFLPFVPTVDRERVLGLEGTKPMESAADIAALGINIVNPLKRLGLVRADRRRVIAEAAAMLDYISGERTSRYSPIVRLVRGIDRQGGQPLGLPRLVLYYPSLLRVFEPLKRRPGHRLADRLHLAAMVNESLSGPSRRKSPSAWSLLGQALVELMALPFRVIFGGRYA
jgi:nucleoside-diphosphate-sugar epimerase